MAQQFSTIAEEEGKLSIGSRALLLFASIVLMVVAVLQLQPKRGQDYASDGLPHTPASDLPVEPEIPVQPDAPLPMGVSYQVPFTVQAPFLSWNQAKYQNACEEASILMVWHWLTGNPLNAQIAYDSIAEIVAYEQEHFGYYIDTSAEDTARLMRDYYGHKQVETTSEVTVERIKQELQAGNLIIVPADGTKLGNPNFVPPGPDRHMLVITGYDDEKGVFITNDPGTRNGEDYPYAYKILLSAIRDYQSGDHQPIFGNAKVMIIIEPMR